MIGNNQGQRIKKMAGLLLAPSPLTIQLRHKPFQYLNRISLALSSLAEKSGEMTPGAVGKRTFCFGDVFGHVGYNFASINRQSEVDIGQPIVKKRTTVTIQPFVIPLWKNVHGGVDPTIPHFLLGDNDYRLYRLGTQ